MKQKGILGLNTVKAFIVVLLAIAIISVVTLIVLGTLGTENMIAVGGRAMSAVVINETHPDVSEVARALNSSSYNSVSCAINIVSNTSAGQPINNGNWTESPECYIAFKGDDLGYNATGADNWYISYNVSYKNRAEITGVIKNTSDGITSFFGNTLTYFALLGVVVIILIISLVIVVVNRFGGGGEGASGGDMGIQSSQPSV